MFESSLFMSVWIGKCLWVAFKYRLINSSDKRANSPLELILSVLDHLFTWSVYLNSSPNRIYSRTRLTRLQWKDHQIQRTWSTLRLIIIILVDHSKIVCSRLLRAIRANLQLENGDVSCQSVWHERTDSILANTNIGGSNEDHKALTECINYFDSITLSTVLKAHT